ncbi:hypothetical protein FRX31_007956 [Thalictrum thalictroides]|uniref:Uncharacterized protein n=1 Tax=Thalictrum thalictroides TaxID=46969 RepID=A0A7J6WYF8_THATH|nr:hypothetical protein FRX31_007956 [Thalictrum thalictroides]
MKLLNANHDNNNDADGVKSRHRRDVDGSKPLTKRSTTGCYIQNTNLVSQSNGMKGMIYNSQYFRLSKHKADKCKKEFIKTG